METEAWLRRRIELKEQAIKLFQEEIGDMRRELMKIQDKAMNDQADYGGDGVKSLNAAPIYDPFVDG